MTERIRCTYCGETFETEQEKGVHVSEEHTDDESIKRQKRGGGRKKNILNDWDGDSGGK